MMIPAFYFERHPMKELSIFIDESGDFGEYDYHSPWYIVTMVFHNQEMSIQEPLDYLDKELSRLGLENHCILFLVSNFVR